MPTPTIHPRTKFDHASRSFMPIGAASSPPPAQSPLTRQALTDRLKLPAEATEEQIFAAVDAATTAARHREAAAASVQAEQSRERAADTIYARAWGSGVNAEDAALARLEVAPLASTAPTAEERALFATAGWGSR